MTIRITITHDEPASDHNICVGVLGDVAGYPAPQMQGTQQIEPGKSATFHVHTGQQIQVWEAPLAIELKVADEIERAMRDPMSVGQKSELDPRFRIRVAKAAIAASRS